MILVTIVNFCLKEDNPNQLGWLSYISIVLSVCQLLEFVREEYNRINC